MKHTRRSFLQTSSMAGAGFFLFKNPILKALTLDNLTVYVPDVEMQTFNDSDVDVFDNLGNFLGSGKTNDSVANFTITDVRNENASNIANYVKVIPGEKSLLYILQNSSNVKVKVYEIPTMEEILSMNDNGYSGEKKLSLNGC